MSRLEEARKKLRSRYLGRLPESADTLRAALARGDVDEIGRMAHRLRGSGGTYGFDEITDAAIAVQLAIAEHRDEMVRALIALCESIARDDTPSDPSMDQPQSIETDARILIVDDDPSIGELLAEVCRRMGHPTLIASSVAAAVTALRSSPRDLIVLDMMLPDGSGLDLLQWLRAHEADSDRSTKVVVLSMMDHPTFVTSAREQGVSAYLLKPFEPRAFERTLRSLLQA